MSYYDNIEEYRKRGIDYDLDACLIYNPQSFSAEDIEAVLAVYEGENEGEDWRWVLKLKDGRFVYLQGGCDYTGWDCQSDAASVFADSPFDAAVLASEGIAERDSSQTAYLELFEQLQNGKAKTWRQKSEGEFGI